MNGRQEKYIPIIPITRYIPEPQEDPLASIREGERKGIEAHHEYLLQRGVQAESASWYQGLHLAMTRRFEAGFAHRIDRAGKRLSDKEAKSERVSYDFIKGDNRYSVRGKAWEDDTWVVDPLPGYPYPAHLTAHFIEDRNGLIPEELKIKILDPRAPEDDKPSILVGFWPDRIVHIQGYAPAGLSINDYMKFDPHNPAYYLIKKASINSPYRYSGVSVSAVPGNEHLGIIAGSTKQTLTDLQYGFSPLTNVLPVEQGARAPMAIPSRLSPENYLASLRALLGGIPHAQS